MGADPTEEQWDAIAWPLEPCVLVAGAGSGKTSVMAARVVYLALAALGRIEGVDPAEGVLPGNVLCLTFTNKATENLRLRVRRALAALELPEGEEPEILNYHGFAASILERYGVLAGFEPGARVLTQAQRSELCGRVLDEMTFEHASATWQPSLVSKILELDEQAQNHRVTPPEIEAHVVGPARAVEERPVEPRIHGGAGTAGACARRRPLPRAEARAQRARFRRSDRPRDLDRCAPSRDRRRPPRAVPSRIAGRVPGHERRPGRADVDAVRAGSPCDGGRGPRSEHLRVARRVALQPPGLPAAVPPGGRPTRHTAAAVHELPIGRPHPGGGGHDHRAGPRGATAGPRQAAPAVPAERRRCGVGHAPAGRVDRGAVDRTRCVAAPRGRRPVVRRRRPLPDLAPVRLAPARVRRARRAGRDPGSRRAAEAAGGGGGPRVRARGAGPQGLRRARADPAGPALPRRLQGPGAGRPTGDDPEQGDARVHDGGRRRGGAVPVRRGARTAR